MTNDTFKKGMALISEAFPKLDFNPTLYWRMLSDLKDSDFEEAIIAIIKETTELFPTSNLIAIIRQKAVEAPRNRLRKLLDEALHAPKLAYEECAAPPKEWTDLVQKVANEKSI